MKNYSLAWIMAILFIEKSISNIHINSNGRNDQMEKMKS